MEAKDRQMGILVEISKKLDKIVGVISIQGRPPDTQIEILTRLGFSSTEIGALTGLHPGSVRKRRSKKPR